MLTLCGIQIALSSSSFLMLLYQHQNVHVRRYKWVSRDTLPSDFDAIAPDSEENSYTYKWPNRWCEDVENDAVVFEGYLKFPRAGTWTIFAKSDDDLRMYIDGNPVLTVDGKIGVRDVGKAVIEVAPGFTFKHVRIEFLELCRGNRLDMQWARPGVSKTDIPRGVWVVGSGNNRKN